MSEMNEADLWAEHNARKAALEQLLDRCVPVAPSLREIKRALRQELRAIREALGLMRKANRAQISALRVDIRNGGGKPSAAEVCQLLILYGVDSE